MRTGKGILAALIILVAAAGLLAALVVAIPSSSTSRFAEPAAGPRTPDSATARQVYSPVISSDPYVVDQWERSIRALEAACRERAEYCDEAAQARRSVGR